MQKLNEELILQCFQQQADKISKMSDMLEKHEKQNLEFREIIEEQDKQNTYMEWKQNMLTTQLKELKKKVKKQNKRIKGQRQVLYQLLGGLFNHTTQRPILRDHLKDIGVIINCSLCKGECHCKNIDIYPTTRQGDECETRIYAIEKTIMNIGRILLGTTESDTVPTFDKESPSDSLSESSGSSGSSMNVKRMQNSYDLCGNQ